MPGEQPVVAVLAPPVEGFAALRLQTITHCDVNRHMQRADEKYVQSELFL
jgi:hypothetical protein